MKLRRPVLLAALVLSVVSMLPSTALEPTPWAGTPTLIGGTSRYDAGEWIYSDFVYDDYGADTVPAGQSNVVSLAPTAGDFRYPNGTTAAGNAADIVEVRARVAGLNLEVRVTLQSIVTAQVPAIWVQTPQATTVFTHLNATVDATDNTVSFMLPGAAAGASLALRMGAGLNDGTGGLMAGIPGYAAANPGAFTTGAPTPARLFDLAFNSHQIEGRGGAWNENAQSAALASGNLTSFVQTIDLDALRNGVTTPVPLIKGHSVHLFRSRQDLGEGMASSFPQYRGRWQPYAVWVPDGYDGSPASLFINMHSLSVHHNQYRGGSAPGASYPTLYEQFGDGLDAVIVTPLGRGPDGWYEDQGLVDTLEVWADVLTRYNIDRDRVFVGGYSMGGYGTYRLTTIMPDSFASAVSIVGPPVNGIWAYPLPPTGGEANPDNTRPQLENTRNVPFWITHGALDELVPVAGIVHQTNRFAELGHEYRFALHPVGDHFAFVFQDEWSREVAWFATHPIKVTDPQRVTFKVRPGSWATNGNPTILAHLTDLIDEVGARLDGAYWTSAIAVANGPDVTGYVDLSSGAIARQQSGVSKVSGVGTDGPSPYALTGQDVVWSDGSTADTLYGHLSKVTSVTVDVGRAGLSDSPAVNVTTDTPTTIIFVRNGVEVGRVNRG